MSCFHGYDFVEGCEQAFAVDASALVFGPGVIAECGPRLRGFGCRRVALFTDARVAVLPPVAAALASLRGAGLDVEVFDEVHVEPTFGSFLAASSFAGSGDFDGYVSVGGGSVIDTCKAAALYATYPAELLAYVNAPVGEGRPVPGLLPPHIACPTTTGTGSEHTGIAVFDYEPLRVKTGIASPRLRPTVALVDPTCARTLPASVVAASGFDVLCHAIESYTARPYTQRATGKARPASNPAGAPVGRPMAQGRNPWSDLGSKEAMTLGGQYLARAVADADDDEARHNLAWAATLAGIAFGNAGVHLPHAMSYAIAGQAHELDFHVDGYPEGETLVPHGLSVAVSAPSVFRATAKACPERHLEAAAALGADLRGASLADAGDILADALCELMRATGAPAGIAAIGYRERDLPALAHGAFAQRRLVDNAPLPVDEKTLISLFRGALAYY